MVIHGQVVEVAYNVQTVVDDKHMLVVDYQTTNQNDRKALHELAVRARRILRAGKFRVLADKGYHNAEQLDACQREGITTYVAPQDAPRSNAIPTPEYYGEQFRYNRQKDVYTCPEGQTMKTTGQWYNKKYDNTTSTSVRHYRTPSCRICPAREQCTTNPAGRIIERSEYARAVEQNQKRIKKHKSVYAARQQIIEHVFGTIKRQWGYDHILLKGIRKNDGEFALIYFTYNLRRILTILGVDGVKKWAKRLTFVKMTIRRFVERCGEIFSAIHFSMTGRDMEGYRIVGVGYCTN